MFLTIWPIFIQDISLEIIVTTGLALVSFFCYFLVRIGIYIPFIVGFVLLFICSVWQYRYNRKFWNNRNGVVSVPKDDEMDHNENWDQELELKSHKDIKRSNSTHWKDFKMKWRSRIMKSNHSELNTIKEDGKPSYIDEEQRPLDISSDEFLINAIVADEEPIDESFEDETNNPENSYQLLSPIRSYPMEEFSASNIIYDEEKL
jgi:hypothetical protein